MRGKFVIWSNEHMKFWAHARLGYTDSLVEAGRYSQAEVTEICDEKHHNFENGRFNEVPIVDPMIKQDLIESADIITAAIFLHRSVPEKKQKTG